MTTLLLPALLACKKENENPPGDFDTRTSGSITVENIDPDSSDYLEIIAENQILPVNHNTDESYFIPEGTHIKFEDPTNLVPGAFDLTFEERANLYQESTNSYGWNDFALFSDEFTVKLKHYECSVTVPITLSTEYTSDDFACDGYTNSYSDFVKLVGLIENPKEEVDSKFCTFLGPQVEKLPENAYICLSLAIYSPEWMEELEN